MIDLHLHSAFSDGTDTPAELVCLALDAGLEAAALTDHDTTDGLGEFCTTAAGTPLTAVCGVEMTCAWYTSDLHIVGLFIDPAHTGLEKLLARQRQRRGERNGRIVAQLQRLDVDITMAEVLAEAPGRTVGRLHIARVLLRKGYCRTLQEAFDRYIGYRAAAGAPYSRPHPAEAIRTIADSGGLSVWGHPGGLTMPAASRLRQKARALARAGLDAVEAQYPDCNAGGRNTIRRLAKEFGLALSGGSDFHGANRPEVMIGRGRGDLNVPLTVLQNLRRRRHQRHAASVAPLPTT